MDFREVLAVKRDGGALEPEQIRAAFNKYIKPDQFVVMKAGDFKGAAAKAAAGGG